MTIEVRDRREVLRATGRFGMSRTGYRQLLGYVRQWPARIWAVEGAHGVGRPLAARLLADGETVVDVPAKLAARVRVFDTGQGRKTDATDAHAVVMVALRTRGLRQLIVDEELAVLRLLADRRDELSRTRTQTLNRLNRLHRLLTELVPGGALPAPDRHAGQDDARAVRPRDLAGRTRRELAAELLSRGRRLSTTSSRQLTRRLRQAVPATGSGLMDLYGIGPAGAARILADVGDVARFPDRNHFASWTGTAPIDASSGAQIRHRLSRAGNRRINHVLYIAAVCQIRHDTPGRRLLPAQARRRQDPDGSHALPAPTTVRRGLPATRRRRRHSQPARPGRPEQAGPGGHRGATLTSSAADLTPVIGSSDKPQPGPAPANATRPNREREDPDPDSRHQGR